MKINSSDVRRVHRTVTVRDGERTQNVIWGDVRTVTIVIVDPGEVSDMASANTWTHRGMWFRPEHAQLEWKRNSHWVGHRNDWRNHTQGWQLTTARINGTNIRADGSLGALTGAALYANEEGWGCDGDEKPPTWFAELLAEHDPNRTGTLLDQEGTE